MKDGEEDAEKRQKERGRERKRRRRRAAYVSRGPSKEVSSQEENSGLRRRGLFVPRRDAFGASYLRVTPCNRAPRELIFLSPFSVCLSFPHRDNSPRRSPRGERERERASPLHARSIFEFEEKVRSARRSAAAA